MGGEGSEVSSELLGLVTLLSANESELARVAGVAEKEVESDEQVVGAVQGLLAKHPSPSALQHILVTRGHLGASLFLKQQPTQPISQKAHHVDKVVDTTGAGDCFRGSLAPPPSLALCSMLDISPQDYTRFVLYAHIC
jgi:ribokinase